MGSDFSNEVINSSPELLRFLQVNKNEFSTPGGGGEAHELR